MDWRFSDPLGLLGKGRQHGPGDIHDPQGVHVKLLLDDELKDDCVPIAAIVVSTGVEMKQCGHSVTFVVVRG